MAISTKGGQNLEQRALAQVLPPATLVQIRRVRLHMKVTGGETPCLAHLYIQSVLMQCLSTVGVI